MRDSGILYVDKVSKYFGGLAAVNNCSLKIKKGSITGIIGPNGSGKTTLFNLIAGNLKSSTGNVIFNNENITNLPSLFFQVQVVFFVHLISCQQVHLIDVLGLKIQ